MREIHVVKLSYVVTLDNKVTTLLLFTNGLTSYYIYLLSVSPEGARCRSVVRAFAHGAMGRRINPSWGGPIELFLVLASDPQLV